MSIIVGKIENKFWSNSDYKFPNGFPVYDEKEELKDVQPNMNNFMTGTVYLFGDQGNHCIYNGNYYSLYIFQVIDENRKFYCYRLERDFGFDVLKARPEVIGDLITSNNDELLEKHLNRTISALDNPARVITINFGEVDFDWRKNFEFKPAEKPIPQKVLTIDDFNSFIESAESLFTTNWKLIDKVFYSKKKNPAVFLIDLLKPSVTLTGGKNILRNKLNDFIRSIPKTDKTKLKIGKVTFTGKNSSSGLVGKYCITQKVEGIAEAGESENYKLKKIDLSGLKDIVPVNIHDLQEITPYTNLLKGAKSGLFQHVDKRYKREKFFGKIKRKAYVPICASSERRPVDVGFGYSGNWNNVNNPQKVTGEYGGVTITDYLWGVDNLNFAIQRTGFDLHTPDATYGPGSRNVREEGVTSISPFPIPGTAGEIFNELTNNEIVSFGFIIYKLSRPSDVWYLFEYKGRRSLKNVEYISGIKRSFVETYRNETKKWWSNFPHQFRNTRHSDELIKFYLDNYMLAIMTLLPGTYYESSSTSNRNYANYLYTDLGGTYVMSKGKYYIPEIIVSDIYNEQGQSISTNPYNSSRYEGYVRERDRKFQKLLNHSFVELPEGVEVEDGDYFFSDLDYEIETRFVPETGKEKGKALFKFADKELNHGSAIFFGRAPFGEFTDQMRLEDFVRLESGTEILRLEPGEEAFALCTTLRGNIDVRKIISFNKTLQVSIEEDEIVQEVEGSKSKNVTFTLLKKLSEPLIPEQGEYRITDQIKAKIIRAFYESIGYKVVGEGEVFWNGFDESDFAETCQDQLLFDLKGTDGYCFITKGKISLICKNETLLEPTETKLTSLLYHENKDLNLSLIEKINQKTRLQFYTAPYYLNWKTRFSEEDRIFLYSTVIKPTVQQTQFEQHFLRLDTGFDRIWYENITIPKKVDKALALADSLAVQKAHLDLIKDQYTYQIDQDRLALATKRYEENIKRSQIELDIQRKESILSAGLSLITGGFGAGLASRVKQIPQALGQEWVQTQGEPYYEIPLVPGTQYVNVEQFKRFPTVMKPKITGLGRAGGLALGAAGFAFGGALKAAKGLISDFAFRFPEMERQIGVEKQLGAEQIGLRSLTINTQHMERQLKTQHSLNQMSNMYHNPFINEREILDQYNAKQEGHGKKLKDIYLVVFVPSEEQLVALRNYKEEFGVMCDIPNITTVFFEGMEPDFIRYRNLDDDAIKGIENLWIREFFKSHLLAGLKIVKVTPKVEIILSTDEYRQQILKLNKDLFKKDEELKDLEGKIQVVRRECDEKDKEITKITERCETEKTELNNQRKQIENQLNNINTQLTAKTKELEAKEKECTDTKKKLEEEIKKHKIDKEEAEQKWDNCKRDYLNEKDEKNRLLKQKEETDKQLAEYEEDKKRLAGNRKELAKKIQELEDIIKQKELLETQKAALIKDYEQERDDRLSALSELRNSESKREELEKQKDDTEKQLSESLAAKRAVEAEKEQIKKTFETCKRNRQQQKTQLEGRIKELQTEKDALEAQKTELQKQKELLENQKSDIERQLREALANRGTSTASQPDDSDAILNELKKFTENQFYRLMNGESDDLRNSPIANPEQALRELKSMNKLSQQKELLNNLGKGFDRIYRDNTPSVIALMKYEASRVSEESEEDISLDGWGDYFKDLCELEVRQRGILATSFVDIEREKITEIMKRIEEKEKRQISEEKAKKEWEKFVDILLSSKGLDLMGSPVQKGKGGILQQGLGQLNRKLTNGEAMFLFDEKAREYCELLKRCFTNSFFIDLKPRESDGGNALRDLILELLQQIKGMRRTNLDTRLGNSRYISYRRFMPKILDLLMRFEEIPVVAKGAEAIEHRQWPTYLQYKKKGGIAPMAIQPILDIIDTITGTKSAGALNMENLTAAHAIKAVLDEINGELHYGVDSTELGGNEDLKYFFKHIYPGKSLQLYQELYGDYQIELIKRRYAENNMCLGTGLGGAFDFLQNIQKTIRHNWKILMES